MVTKTERGRVSATIYKISHKKTQMFVPIGSGYLEIIRDYTNQHDDYSVDICHDAKPYQEPEETKSIEMERNDVANMLRIYRNLKNHSTGLDNFDNARVYTDEFTRLCDRFFNQV